MLPLEKRKQINSTHKNNEKVLYSKDPRHRASLEERRAGVFLKFVTDPPREVLSGAVVFIVPDR
jgi:hypothetical protein